LDTVLSFAPPFLLSPFAADLAGLGEGIALGSISAAARRERRSAEDKPLSSAACWERRERRASKCMERSSLEDDPLELFSADGLAVLALGSAVLGSGDSFEQAKGTLQETKIPKKRIRFRKKEGCDRCCFFFDLMGRTLSFDWAARPEREVAGYRWGQTSFCPLCTHCGGDRAKVFSFFSLDGAGLWTKPHVRNDSSERGCGFEKR